MPLSSIDSVRLETLFAPWDQPQAPGMAVGIIQQGHLVYTRCCGLANLENEQPITASSVFHVASLSKQITAMLVMQLALEGTLSLDDEIRTYVPLLPDYQSSLTVRHCLWHTSGLRDQWELLYLAGWRDGDLVTTTDIVQLLHQQQRLNFPPGTEFCYCNSGYTLLGLVIEHITGISLRTYAQKQIFGPLGMVQTLFQDDHTVPVKQRVIAYTQQKNGHLRIQMPMFDTIGATGLLTTIEDLTRWIAHLDLLYRTDSDLLTHLLSPGRLTDGHLLPYGGGLFLGHYQGWQTVYHTGSDYGYRAQMQWLPERQEAILVLCNTGTINTRLLVQQMLDILVDNEYEEPHSSLAPLSPSLQTASDEQMFVGLYYHPPTEAIRRCFLENGQLKLAYEPGLGIDLLSLGNGQFRLSGTSTHITFSSDSQHGQWWLEETNADGLTTAFEAVSEATPTAEMLDAYTGTYMSEEVATTYHIVVRDHELWLLHQKFSPRLLSPTLPACFWMEENFRLRFEIVDEQVVGVSISTDRVRRVSFWKQTTKKEQ